MDVAQTRGRRYPEPEHPYRNAYARDRDRMIHSRAFRRLEARRRSSPARLRSFPHAPDAYHRSGADRAHHGARLCLNSDLAEALALAHDIGHPPFGHAGERRLDAACGGTAGASITICRRCASSRVRVALSEFPGTQSDLRGPRRHRQALARLRAGALPELAEYLLDQRPPLEAQLIDFVDEIAYNTRRPRRWLEVEAADRRKDLPSVYAFLTDSTGSWSASIRRRR